MDLSGYPVDQVQALVPALEVALVAQALVVLALAQVEEEVAVLAVAPLVVVVPVEAQPEAVLAVELGEAQVVAQEVAQEEEEGEAQVVAGELDHTLNSQELMPRTLPAVIENNYIRQNRRCRCTLFLHGR